MVDEKLECPECGKVFGSEELLKKHSRLEHGTSSIIEMLPDGGYSLEDVKQQLSRFKPANLKSFGYGFVAAVLICSAAFSGYLYWNSLDHRVDVPITTVTCENCSYEPFKTATDRMFNAQWNEVDYQSQRGQELIQKYNIKYVPAFIFSSNVEEAEAFPRVESVLVKFEDGYVIPDRGNRVAQRLSQGMELEQ